MIYVDKSDEVYEVGFQRSSLRYTYLTWFDADTYGYYGQTGSLLDEYDFIDPIGPTSLVEWQDE